MKLCWEKVSDKAPWVPRDSSGELIFNDKLWLLGGWPGEMRDVWNSEDGITWKQVLDVAPWIYCDLPAAMVYKDRMWFMAGWQGGRSPSADAGSEVWHSQNGKDWTCATKNADWGKRMAPGGVVFNNKMWIMGGTRHYFNGDEHLLNDVWCSENGEDWELVTEHAPWAPRAHHVTIVFNNKIYVMGGGNYWPKYHGYNDIWSSSDGLNWELEIEHAGWSDRLWFSSLVYKNHLWVLGGWSDFPSKNMNDVWYSADGKNWKELKNDIVWSERHEMSAYAFKDKMWIMAGNAWPILNDIWSINIPEEVLI